MTATRGLSASLGLEASRVVMGEGRRQREHSSVDCRLENGSAMSVKEEKRQERRKQGQESRQRDSEVEGGHGGQAERRGVQSDRVVSLPLASVSRGFLLKTHWQPMRPPMQ